LKDRSNVKTPDLHLGNHKRRGKKGKTRVTARLHTGWKKEPGFSRATSLKKRVEAEEKGGKGLVPSGQRQRSAGQKRKE